MKREAHPQSLPFRTFRDLSKGHSPPGSPDKAPTARCPISRAPFNYLSEFPVNGSPVILQRAAVEKGAHLQRLHKAPVDEPPTKFPNGAPTENDVRPLSPSPYVLPDPQKAALPNRAPAKRDAPFPEPPNYLLKIPSQRNSQVPQVAPVERDDLLQSFLLHLSLRVPSK